MDSKDLYSSFGALEDELLERSEGAERGRKGRRRPRWAPLAACLAVVVLAAAAVPALLRGSGGREVALGTLTRVYREETVTTEEMAVVWPWEEQTAFEQYGTLVFNGVAYGSRRSEISPDLLGEELGSGEGVGWDPATGEEHRRSLPVREISGIAPELMAAAELDGAWCVFLAEDFVPPAVFGELLDSCDLPRLLTLDYFTVEGAGEESYRTLAEDEGLWEILSACRSAPSGGQEVWAGDGVSLSFSATAQSLGVYKRVFTVSTDGWLRTNLFDVACCYQIGEAAAGELMALALEEGEETAFRPYDYLLAGILTEIGDGYLLIDDSPLCADPEEGMVFRVSTEDLRISRCLRGAWALEEGDLAAVRFTGDVDTANGNLVTGAYDLSRAYLSDGEVLIPE